MFQQNYDIFIIAINEILTNLISYKPLMSSSEHSSGALKRAEVLLVVHDAVYPDKIDSPLRLRTIFEIDTLRGPERAKARFQERELAVSLCEAFPQHSARFKVEFPARYEQLRIVTGGLQRR